MHSLLKEGAVREVGVVGDRSQGDEEPRTPQPAFIGDACANRKSSTWRKA